MALNRSHPGRELYAAALKGKAQLLVLDEATVEEENTYRWPRLLRPYRFLAGVLRLRRFIRRQAPDAVLVSSGGWPPTALAWRFLCAARLAGVRRVVLAAHNYPLPAAGGKGLYRRLAGGLATRLCRDLISVSQDCARAITGFNLMGRPAGVVSNGMAPRHEPHDAEEKRRELGLPGRILGAIGNIEERKGYATLLRAMPEVCRRFPDVRLVIIGAAAEKPCHEDLLRLIAQMGLADKVRLTGFLPNAGRFAECFEICVIPSIARESFGLLALEAMRYAKPVVAARTGGLPEVVHGEETGLIVAPRDPQALAAALCALLENPELARRMGERGRALWGEEFSAARMARRYQELLTR